jgi:hypothetical protein
MDKNCRRNINPTSQSSVGAFFAKFNAEGITADFADRRGNRSKVVVIDFQASGIKSYARNKNITFDYDEELNRANIKSIEVLSTAQLQFVNTQPPKDAPQTDFNKGILVIKDQCNFEIMRTPLSNLCKALNGNKSTFVDFKNIDWGKCYITFPGTATITSSNAIAFKISFQ